MTTTTTRRSRGAVFAALVAGIALSTVPPVGAHTVSDHYARTWNTRQCAWVIFFCSNRDMTFWTSGGNWPADAQGRAADSAGIWSDVPTNRYFNFRYQGHRNDLSVDCSRNGYNENADFWTNVPEVSGPGLNTLGHASVCSTYDISTLSYRHRSFVIENDIEDYGDFWFGAGQPPGDRMDFIGYSDHEFGHATGFGIGARNTHFVDGSSDCPTDNVFARQSMCPWNDYWGTIYTRTLAEHDRHTFQGAYA